MSRNNFKYLLIIFVSIVLISIGIKFSFAATKGGPSIIQFQASDGFNLAGMLDIPKTASVKHKAPLVIYLHSLGRSKSAWMTLPLAAKKLGYATLCLDLRGHGQSVLNKKNKPKYWTNFKSEDFKKMPGDITSAIKYLKTEYPEINVNRITIVGANVGANVGIIASSLNRNNIKSLILISPSLSFKGLDTRIPLVGYGNHPLLIVVSKQDSFYYYSSTELIKYAQGVKLLKTYPFGGDDIELIKFQPDARNQITNWLKKYS